LSHGVKKNWGFQGRTFLNLHIMFFESWSKKKLGFSQLLGRGGGSGLRL